MLSIRCARPEDVPAMRDVYVAVYGNSYVVPEFYDVEWLTRFIYDDECIVLVADDGGRILGSAAALLATGDSADLLALLGRFVVHPEAQGRGVGAALARERVSRIQERVHVAFGEVRAPSLANQKLMQKLEFVPNGFLPSYSQFASRESDVLHLRLFGGARALRRNNPRLIPEAARLANLVLPWVDLPADAIFDDTPDAYPTDEEGLSFEPLTSSGLASLLPLRRHGSREIFGKGRLAGSLFQLARTRAEYIVARKNGMPVGAVGFRHDAHNAHVRIFDLIASRPEIAGTLLARAENLARSERAAVFVDADVSAYSPCAQRTLARLGFAPVAYFPAMVFEDVERLDAVRMAKLSIPYDPGDLEMLERCAQVRALVEIALETSAVAGIAIDAMKRLSLFTGLDDPSLAELGRIARRRRYAAGEIIVREGDAPGGMFVLTRGEARVEASRGRRANIRTGQLFGEMAFAETAPRSANVISVTDCEAIEFGAAALLRLADTRPRLGALIMRNLVRELAAKLLEP